jgi:protein-tyrosine-phosphatase/predicted ATP-grasp superfamily ATP-dependent carboligase
VSEVASNLRPSRAAALIVRALVIGDDTRSFLAVVRSLGRAGWEVDAAPFDFSSPALRSRYLRRIHRVPPYSVSAEGWVETMRGLIAEGYDLVLPCDDRGLIPLQRHAGELGRTCLALPNDEAMRVFFDKGETRRLAVALGIPVAPGKDLEDADSAVSLADDFGLPLALKPRRSYALGQAAAKSSVSIVRTIGDLAAALAAVQDRSAWLVEGFFSGEGVGLSVLADRGKILLAFQHRRIAEASETGGSSSRTGEEIDPRLLDAVSAMARATSLHGVAMFEFRRAPADGRFILLEVNCRFWGSLPLALASGVDFPAAAARLHVSGEATSGNGYRAGLLLKDLGGEYYRLLRHASAAPSLPGKALRAASGLSRLFLSLAFGAGFDSHAADDPAPWRQQRRQLLRTILSAFSKRLTSSRSRRRRAEAALDRVRAAIDAQRREIVMLCHGNICRSPFAEQRLRRKAAEAGLTLDIFSAGTIGLEGRRAPDDAIEAARAFGADLGDHRSRFLDVATARSAGAVIVFDDRNVDELGRLGLNGDVNLLRLADLIGRPEIGDPYGHGPDGFARVYSEIDEAVDRLVSAIAGPEAAQ